MKILFKLKFILVFFTLLSIIVSCNDNDDNDYYDLKSSESKALNQAKKWAISNEVSIENINWSKARFLHVNTVDSYLISVPVKTNSEHQVQKLVVSVNENLIKGKLWDFYSTSLIEKELIEDYSAHDVVKNFTGSLKIFNLETNTIESFWYKNGINLSSKSSSTFKSANGGSTACNICHGT